MPNLFEMLKGGLGVFGGPGLPGQMAGAAMMRASGPDSTGIEALGAGIQTGLQTREALAEQQRLREGRIGVELMLADVGYDRAGLQRAFAMSLGSGDVEGAKMLSEVIKSLPEQRTPVRNLQAKEAVNPETGQVEWANFDPATGTMSFTGVRPAPAEQAEYNEWDPNSPTGYSRVRIVDGQKVVLGPVGGGAAGVEAGGSAQERMNAQLAQTALSAAGDLDRLDHVLASRGAAMYNMSQDMGQLGAMVGRTAAGPEMQQASAAANNFLNPVVRYFSGAQMTEAEAQRYMGALLPLPGESESTLVMKRRYRAELLAAMQGGADKEEIAELSNQYSAIMNNGDNPAVAEALAAAQVDASIDAFLGNR